MFQRLQNRWRAWRARQCYVERLEASRGKEWQYQTALENDNMELALTVRDLADAGERMLKLCEALMPGVRYIALQNYAEANEAPIAMRKALQRAGR